MLSFEGMGSESRVPSGRMGLACPPLALSKPFLLRMIFMGREKKVDGCWCALVKSPLAKKGCSGIATNRVGVTCGAGCSVTVCG